MCSVCNSTPCNCYASCGGCPVNLDFSCVFYHKDNNQISELDGLGLSNGATLQLVIETIDEKVKQLNINGFSLPCLRVSYVINTLKQFAEAVDTEICLMKTDIQTAITQSQQALVANDSSTIDFTTSGNLGHTLTGVVKISAAANNLLSDNTGLYAAPQTLSINYTTKEMTISNGNTVSFASIICGASGFLGNLASDPTAIDGQYYWNTVTPALRIKVNGLWKTITTS